MQNEGDLFSFLGELKLTLNGLNGEMRKANEQRQRIQELAYKAEQPAKVNIAGAVFLSASGFGIMKLNVGGPTQGYKWNVRRLSIAGATPSTSVAGRADVYVSAMGYAQFTDFTQVSMADWADQATSLPLVGTYGDGELELAYPEKLHVIISGGLSGQQVFLGGMAQMVQLSAARQTTNI